jgi:ubiquinone/menaquinone biosynthesis C-methylase UbiE
VYFQLYKTIPLLSRDVAPEIPQSALVKAKIHANRYLAVEKEWPSNAKILEVGTQTGEFANFIFEKKKPSDLQVLDISYHLFKDNLPCDSSITKHVGRSIEVMAQLPDNYFDVVYIDASHDYNDVRLDIEHACRITKVNGLIVCNDYIWYSPAEFSEYGVIRAVNELVIARLMKIKYFALHTQGFFDIAIVNSK